jgi:hypothetical protein
MPCTTDFAMPIFLGDLAHRQPAASAAATSGSN